MLYTFAYLLLVAAFLCSLFLAGAILVQFAARPKILPQCGLTERGTRTGVLASPPPAVPLAFAALKNTITRSLLRLSDKYALALRWVEGVQAVVTGLMTLCCVILLFAFISYDFSVEYVASYSDRALPLFYRMTALWAGQSGSLLFWAWSVAISGSVFCLTPAYKRLHVDTRLWFWVFFFGITGFFLLLLTSWSNPFLTLPVPPPDGRGLNPLLQNPGMIFHPPLLFLGYGGFVVPGCLALSQTLTGRLHDPSGYPEQRRSEPAWGQAARPFILVAWLLLTAGIILGAWWAYMELGWGGYWAWDPVENASLIPWLVATAYLHTAVIESRRGKLRRTNVFLMGLTTISAFFATYLVRSGVVQSLHAFGDGGVGLPLLIFTLASLALAAFVALIAPRGNGKELEEPLSKEGLLIMVSWLLLALSLLILIATLWPVILNGAKSLAPYLPSFLGSRIPQNPMGLEPGFYNRACLPLFALLALLLLFCPYSKWKAGIFHPRVFFVVLGVFVALLVFLLIFSKSHFGLEGTGLLAGLRLPQILSSFAAALAVAGLCGLVTLYIINRKIFARRSALAAHGVHVGFLLIVLGVAFSGVYQETYELTLSKGQSARIGNYAVRLEEFYQNAAPIPGAAPPAFKFVEADLTVFSKDNEPIGSLMPQRRWYASHERQPHAEVSTLFSLGNEIYATLLQVDPQRRASLLIHVNPLINWLWIGGILMCLFPFLGLAAVQRQRETDQADENGAAPSDNTPAAGTASS